VTAPTDKDDHTPLPAPLPHHEAHPTQPGEHADPGDESSDDDATVPVVRDLGPRDSESEMTTPHPRRSTTQNDGA
jgi:hypothetical protein